MNHGIGLFDTVTNDPLRFGIGSSFEPKRVTEALGLKKQDVSRLASVSVKSVRYDDAMPEQMRERLEEIAQTVNLVAHMFDGDAEKAVAWFKARNPMLGDVSPREMIRLGRYERLRKFIVNALLERTSERPTVASAH
ncbi:MAG: antitoxin Xre/MbcA/ParS toxin-binding domain-containing protein [Rubrivivax sp.]